MAQSSKVLKNPSNEELNQTFAYEFAGWTKIETVVHSGETPAEPEWTTVVGTDKFGRQNRVPNYVASIDLVIGQIGSLEWSRWSTGDVKVAENSAQPPFAVYVQHKDGFCGPARAIIVAALRYRGWRISFTHEHAVKVANQQSSES